MKKNMGKMDKTIRLVIAIIIAVLYFVKVISGTFAIVLGVLAIVFAMTSMVSFCPLYAPFGFSTRSKENE